MPTAPTPTQFNVEALDAEILSTAPSSTISANSTTANPANPMPLALWLFMPVLIITSLIVGWSGLTAYLQAQTEAAYQEGLSAGKTAGLTEGRTQVTAELQPQVEQANQQAAAAEAAKAEAVAQKAVCDVSIAQIKSVLGVP